MGARFIDGRRIWLLTLLVVLAAWFGSTPLLAATVEPAQMDWFLIGMNLFGGLALFLYGLDKLADALKALAGDQLKTLLETLTGNRIIGALVGAVVTAILNSSSVTTVLVVGFVTAGVMNLSQAIGVIMGANIGSTMTAQIVAFNVTELSLTGAGRRAQ